MSGGRHVRVPAQPRESQTIAPHRNDSTRPHFGSGFERLEDRSVPAIVSFAVNTTDDTPFAAFGMNLITQQMSPLDANGNTSLRAVVEYGNANAQNGDWNTNHYNVDFLRVAGGTITLTQNTTLALNTNFNFFNGAITVERSSAPNTPAFNHFDIIADTESHFVSMTLTNGKSGVSGGSIYNSGTIQFMSCTFMNNASAGSGGAIYTRSGATATLSSCTFTDNSADDNGGAVAADADSLATSFANCTITGNSAKMHGGAIASEVPHGPWTRG